MATYAWLIERRIAPGENEYLSASQNKFTWVIDPNKALRFARELDADTIIGNFLLFGAYPAEHAWDLL